MVVSFKYLSILCKISFSVILSTSDNDSSSINIFGLYIIDLASIILWRSPPLKFWPLSYKNVSSLNSYLFIISSTLVILRTSFNFDTDIFLLRVILLYIVSENILSLWDTYRILFLSVESE